MSLIESIERIFNSKDKDFLISHIDIFRNNIISLTKNIKNYSILIVSLIAIAFLLQFKVITKINFFITEIDEKGLAIALLAMPIIIAYYTYLLFNRIVLRGLLDILYAQTIQFHYPVISKYNIDEFLIIESEIKNDTLLSQGTKNKWLKIIISILSIPFLLFFQYIPIIYCFILITFLYTHPISLLSHYYTVLFFITSLTAIIFIRGYLILFGSFELIGGMKKISAEMIEQIIQTFKT